MPARNMTPTESASRPANRAHKDAAGIQVRGIRWSDGKGTRTGVDGPVSSPVNETVQKYPEGCSPPAPSSTCSTCPPLPSRWRGVPRSPYDSPQYARMPLRAYTASPRAKNGPPTALYQGVFVDRTVEMSPMYPALNTTSRLGRPLHYV